MKKKIRLGVISIAIYFNSTSFWLTLDPRFREDDRERAPLAMTMVVRNYNDMQKNRLSAVFDLRTSYLAVLANVFMHFVQTFRVLPEIFFDCKFIYCLLVVLMFE